MSQNYICRFCYEESNDIKDFITPCKCSGSVKYVHRSCLDIWRSLNPDGENFNRCNVCKFNYVITELEEPIEEKQKRDDDYYREVSTMLFKHLIIFILVIVFVAIMIFFYDNIFMEQNLKYNYGYKNNITTYLILSIKFLSNLIVIYSVLKILKLDEETVRIDFSSCYLAALIYAILGGIILAILVIIFYYSIRIKNISRKIYFINRARVMMVKDFTGIENELTNI